ncbi:hypothetical protein [Ichthyobacterium seriolicida]|uniref:FeoB-associated Cys-rich membrane protein n=1 Tax=Ichthyobacterium seriolicida TaxID=242600 RepID=A0A1J1DZS7_9FLAO|nr:hypothetical protein [Ichthyobacterium seriolicida]BAV95409.1 hypothetical protein JBKA6_1396 [Ichthyobacterium seriolicida]
MIEKIIIAILFLYSAYFMFKHIKKTIGSNSCCNSEKGCGCVNEKKK